MARKTKKEALETREAILDAAAITFVEEGVAKASLEAIATKAGVTRGAVYWHFKNKVDILMALHEQLYVPFMDLIAADIEQKHPHPLKQLEELCVQTLLEVETLPQKQRVLTIFFLKCDYSGDLAAFLPLLIADKQKSMAMTKQYFIRAKELGHLPADADLETLIIAAYCYWSGVCQQYLMHEGLFTMKDSAASLMRLFFAGLEARNA